jgi:hypothetical protein
MGMASKKWIRHRFTTKADDCRPLVFNKSYPWWRSGYDSDDNAIIIAFLPASEPLERYWDDAFNITDQDECDGPSFTSRFAKPDYYVPLDEASP